MVVTYLPVILVPVAVSIVVTVVIVYTLVICICGKSASKNEPELTDVKTQRESTVQSPSSPGDKNITEQNDVADPAGVQLEPDTAITPQEQGPKQNGTLHSRGNSADLTRPDRRSGASIGSSPRQAATLSRELPDIPIQSHDKGNHTHLPEVPPGSRPSNFKPDSSARGTHSHLQLPDIPKSAGLEHNSKGANRADIPAPQRNKSTTIPRTNAETKTVRLSAQVPAPGSSNAIDLDDYDHITDLKHKKNRPRSDYDHVLIEGNEKKIIPARQVDDPDYAEVQTENIYEGVPDDVTVVAVKTVKSTPNMTQTQTKTSIMVGKAPVKESCVDDPDPPYNKIKDESASIKDTKEPPYKKVKDDLSYPGIKDSTDPYNTVKDYDPYNKVKDEGELATDDIDPYNTVVDTDSEKPVRKFPVGTKNDGPNYDPYALLDDDINVSNQSSFTDPYSRVCDTEIDDPYNRVVDDEDSVGARATKRSNVKDTDTDAGYSTVNKVERVEYATVNKMSIRRKNEETKNENQLKPQAIYAPDEYSTVMKVRQAHDEVPGTSQSENAETTRLSQPPEEPPRDYDDDDENTNTDADHYNTVSQVSQDRTTAVATTAAFAAVTSAATATTALAVTSMVTTAVNDTAGSNNGPDVKKKEPPYSKLSARESLASMNARLASNTYETVSEVDNLYATVEGGSGDGVVQPKSEPVQGRASVTELYAEIDAAPAPAPPSLDSLHETAKQQNSQRTPVQGHSRTPSGQGHIRTPSDQGQVRTPSSQGHFRTPSGDKNSVEARVTLATEEVVDLDPANYRPRAATPDDLEYDPNYETVEEAKSKAKYEEINGSSKTDKKIRAHVYEEVTVTNEARRTKQRVLNLHTYEDITDVKDLENKNRESASGDPQTQKSKTMDGRLSNEMGASGGDSKSKKSKSEEKTKDKGKDKKKTEKDKPEKSGKSIKK